MTGLEEACELMPPGLQTIATKLWVATDGWLTDTAITDPDPTWASSWPVLVSKIDRP